MSLSPKETKSKKTGETKISNVYKLELGNIKTLSKEYINNHPDMYENWYIKYVNGFRTNSDITVDDMKKLINPTATSKDFKDFVTNVLITDEIRYAKFYLEVVSRIEDPEFDIEHFSNDYFIYDYKLFALKQKIEKSDYEKSKRFTVFKKFLSSNPVFKSKTILDCLDTALKFKMTSFQESTILEIYELYCLSGLDIEDKSTWNDRFEWLFNFRFYRKYSKMLSTYIYGKVGRSSVWYVDKDSYSNGDNFTPRELMYDEVDKDVMDISDKTTMFQSDFMVNMADSGRWKATMHTLPAGPTVKGIFTSRFKGGVIFCPDCSQAEVRVLAAQSQDQNLINAFMQDGMDIHKFVASLCFHQGDIEKVTPAERKLAKGAVFGILYGESVKSFADSFFHGDIQEAEKIFEYFYTAFPGIKDYVEESHRQFDRFGKVILPIMNRYINMESFALENGEDKDRIYRQCQNFIIQGQTCDLAGLILYNVCKYIEENNLKTKVLCFIHDSLELDCPSDETFLIADKLKPLFNEYPYKEFGVPMASDIVVGASMGQESDIEVLSHDEKYNAVKVSLSGFEDDIEELISIWKDVYDKVVVVSKEITKETYVPIGGLFQQKVVISKLMGTTRKEGKYILNIVRDFSLL
jgi:hypothetical protein